jgi:hypothetical protein
MKESDLYIQTQLVYYLEVALKAILVCDGIDANMYDNLKLTFGKD